MRVFKNGYNNANGSWIMKADDIAGLTPAQIKNKYALDYIPDKICDVNIPSGTNIYIGVAAPNYNEPGMVVQYDLDWNTQDS